ncbi:hypothetical protein QX249_12450 [Vibrio parahaemolyticus]|uniref:Uncharacterized protein n=1 Tax=Vibrio parahaemolyticus TaxID=670 RepID=A0AAW8Q1I1_VIBPH|nr:hypothetical protein [Vibrio parahaemolyticus]EGR2227429.1 hypothetical protein [Vibrio parahaemolyticus]MDS1821474.1 hypothetical protein [Vibrio parahaemolyticus]
MKSEVIQLEVSFKKNDVSIWDLKMIQPLIDALDMMNFSARLDSAFAPATNVNFIKSGILNGKNITKEVGVKRLYQKGVVEMRGIVSYRLNVVRQDGNGFCKLSVLQVLDILAEFAIAYSATSHGLVLKN